MPLKNWFPALTCFPANTDFALIEGLRNRGEWGVKGINPLSLKSLPIKASTIHHLFIHSFIYLFIEQTQNVMCQECRVLTLGGPDPSRGDRPLNNTVLGQVPSRMPM